MSDCAAVDDVKVKLNDFSGLMARVDAGIIKSGTCTTLEFYVLGTVVSGGASMHYIMRASLEPVKQYAPMVGKTGKEVIEWNDHAKYIMTTLDMEKFSIGEAIYVKPAALGEGRYYRTQWCQIVRRPTNAVYVDPRKLWIDINSIVEI